MAKKKTEAADNEKVIVMEVLGVEVTHFLDRDPNDPRNVGPTPLLPSLDDEVAE